MRFRNLSFKKKNNIQCDRFNKKDKNDYRLRTKLISRLNGDWKKADELIGRARFCDPGRSYSYYCHKVIINWKKINKIN